MILDYNDCRNSSGEAAAVENDSKGLAMALLHFISRCGSLVTPCNHLTHEILLDGPFSIRIRCPDEEFCKVPLTSTTSFAKEFFFSQLRPEFADYLNLINPGRMDVNRSLGGYRCH